MIARAMARARNGAFSKTSTLATVDVRPTTSREYCLRRARKGKLIHKVSKKLFCVLSECRWWEPLGHCLRLSAARLVASKNKAFVSLVLFLLSTLASCTLAPRFSGLSFSHSCALLLYSKGWIDIQRVGWVDINYLLYIGIC